MKFIRATNASGTSWGTPQTLDSAGIVGLDTSLAIFNGNPAISYSDATNEDLKFIRANNADGTSWGSPQIMDSAGIIGGYTSLAIVNGNPAISYFDASNRDLKYINVTSVDIAVANAGTSINNGDTLDFGTTTFANPVTRTLTITNNGYSALDLTGLSLPAGYSFTGNIPTEVAIGGSENIAIELKAVQTGTFTGNFEIGSSDTNLSPFTIALTGTITETHGEIAVSDGNTNIDDGSGSFNYGTTTLGTPVSHTFTIENSSTEDLNLYSLNLPAGFSLQGTYKHTLITNEITNITVRLDAISVGTYSGQFSLANDDADENPFNFTIEGIVADTSGEIAVLDGSTGITDGETTPINFGDTTLGSPISRTFTIQNLGSNALDIYSLTLPSGFSLQGSYNHVVAPSGTTFITVQLDSQFVGSYSGEFSLSSDDADENPFNFAISGEVMNTALGTDIIVPLNGSTVLDSQLQVAFNHDVLHDGSAEAADNPVNYLLVEDGTNSLFDTSTCLAGVAGDDIQQTITSVTYDDSTYIATINTDPLPAGRYQLLACGTASIQDATGNVLNGGAFDSATTFTVVSASDQAAAQPLLLRHYSPPPALLPVHKPAYQPNPLDWPTATWIPSPCKFHPSK